MKTWLFYSYFPCRILKCFTHYIRTWQQILFMASKTSTAPTSWLHLACDFEKSPLTFWYCFITGFVFSYFSTLYLQINFYLLFSIPPLPLSCMSDCNLSLNSDFFSKIYLIIGVNNTIILIVLSHNLSGSFHSKLLGTRSLPRQRTRSLGTLGSKSRQGSNKAKY